ncbi:MAG: tetratricopeptide repeat protein, partial [Anaerolineae bacterium]
AELCRRLDGLPLAIELVAARVRLLSPAELLARLHGPWMLSMDGLRDVSPRQKTLRSAIGWSYGLLTPTEQTLFTRLAVFVGGCTLAAAEMLCDADATLTPSLPFSLSSTQVLDGIASLLDKSLLHRQAGLYGEPRYVMLETVREFGLERVAMSGQEAALRARHANCCLRLIENAERTDFSTFRMHLRLQIDSDIHNLRAAHRWAIEQDSQAALLIAAALVNWLYARGPLEEGRLLIAATLASPGASAHTIPRAKMLFEAGMMLAYEDPGQAQAFQEESLELSQELGYVKGEADALTGLGRIGGISRFRDMSAAQRYLERALAIYRERHDLGGIAYATDRLAQIAYARADYSLAAVLANECLVIAQQSGFLNTWAPMILGNIAYAHGDLVEARSRWKQGMAHMDSKYVIASILLSIGYVASIQGDFPAAHAYLDESRSLWRSTHGEEQARVRVAPVTALLLQKKGDYENAVRWYRASLSGLDLEDTWVACSLGLATLASALDQHEVTGRLLGKAHAVDEIVKSILPYERDDYNRLADATRAALGAAAFDAAWAEGHAAAIGVILEEAVSALEGVLRVDDQPLSA